MEAEEYVPLSGLQHLLYCERQAALIHVERLWREDGATASGRVLHERADLPGGDHRRGVRSVRALPLRCDWLGLVGLADVVEWLPDPATPGGRPYPVEYKRGKRKSLLADQVQLCAQALCLEEMFAAAVPSGALYYGQSHRRVEVSFDAPLRQRTEQAALRLRTMLRNAEVPRAVYGPACRGCSLRGLCLPEVSPGQAGAYLAGLLSERPAKDSIWDCLDIGDGERSL